MMKIAITGGIGSGKTTICNYLSDRGIPIFNCDLVAKELLLKPEVKIAVNSFYGGHVDLETSRQILFTNDNVRKKVMSKIGYLVLLEYEKFCKENRNVDFTLFESAVLAEYGLLVYFDYIVGVISNKLTRAERVKERSGISSELIEVIMSIQSDDDTIIDISNFVLYNNDDLDTLMRKTDDLYLMLQSKVINSHSRV